MKKQYPNKIINVDINISKIITNLHFSYNIEIQ